MTAPPNETIGEEIRRRRAVLDLTQGELADLAGVHRDTIGNLETGKSATPHRGKVRSLRAALDNAEAERGIVTPSPEPAPAPIASGGVIRVIVEGHDGKTFTLEAPPEHVHLLERLVDRILANLPPAPDFTG